jgi:hypothetical protein
MNRLGGFLPPSLLGGPPSPSFSSLYLPHPEGYVTPNMTRLSLSYNRFYGNQLNIDDSFGAFRPDLYANCLHPYVDPTWCTNQRDETSPYQRPQALLPVMEITGLVAMITALTPSVENPEWQPRGPFSFNDCPFEVPEEARLEDLPQSPFACTSEGHLAQLHLTLFGLSGTLPDKLSLLKYLTYEPAVACGFVSRAACRVCRTSPVPALPGISPLRGHVGVALWQRNTIVWRGVCACAVPRLRCSPVPWRVSM